MHQLASIILSYVLSPFNWIILLLIAGYFFDKPALKKTCNVLAVFLFLVFGSPWLLNWYANKWQPSPVAINTANPYSCGILLGGFVSPYDGANGYFNATADRFIQAVKLYKTGEIKHILISGGNGKTNAKDFREAAWAKNELISIGIPDTAILIEDLSDNTIDNARNTKHILDSVHFQPPYLLITSAFHIPRASLIFRKAGLDVVPFPCNYSGSKVSFSFWDLLPTPSTLLSWDRYLKEAVGYWWVKLK